MSKSRREFLRELGATALYLPFLPSLFPMAARAQSGKPPLRLAIFYGYNGVRDNAFWPTANPTMQVAPGVYSTKLTDIISQNGSVSRTLGPALNPLANKFSIIRGLSQAVSAYGADNIVHDGASVLSLSHIRQNSDSYGHDAPKVGSSLDCIVENSPSFYATPTRRSAIRVAGGSGKWNFSFWRPEGGMNPTYDKVSGREYLADNPTTVYNYLLSGVTGSGSVVANPAYREKAFDAVLMQFNALSKSSVVSAVDRERLQSHTDFMRDLKRRIGSTTTPGNCSPGTLLSGTRVIDRWTNNLNSIAAAFACDVTRVACYTMGSYDDDGKITWDSHHNNSHAENSSLASKGLSTDNEANCAAWTGWQANRIAQFMTTLNSMRESDGSTVLDNTLIIWTNQHGGTHCISNYPMLIGGGAAGQFKMGEYIDYRFRSSTTSSRTLGRPLTNLWMAAMRSLGVPAAEYLKQGEDGAYGQGLRSGDKFASGYGSGLATMRRELIPYFYTGPA